MFLPRLPSPGARYGGEGSVRLFHQTLQRRAAARSSGIKAAAARREAFRRIQPAVPSPAHVYAQPPMVAGKSNMKSAETEGQQVKAATRSLHA